MKKKGLYCNFFYILLEKVACLFISHSFATHGPAPKRHPNRCSRLPYQTREKSSDLESTREIITTQKKELLPLQGDFSDILNNSLEPGISKAPTMAAEAPLHYEASADTTNVQTTNTLPSEVVQCLQNARFVCPSPS